MSLYAPWVLLALVSFVALLREWQWQQKVWLSAFLEQGAAEARHDVAWRVDQRIRTIQQRLSRFLGPKAFDKDTRDAVTREVLK